MATFAINKYSACFAIISGTFDDKLLAPINSYSSKEIIPENAILIGHRSYFRVNGHSAEGKQSDTFVLIRDITLSSSSYAVTLIVESSRIGPQNWKIQKE